MTPEAAAFPTFTCFSRLPTELRIKIWRETLPDRDRPALVFYKKGCWQPRRLAPSDEEYSEVSNLVLEHRPEMLGDIEVKVPLASVNQESRSIALVWAREQSVEIRFGKEIQELILSRPFNPERDTLYVPYGKFAEFHNEIMELPEDLGLHISGEIYSTYRAELTHIAVPEMLLRSGESADEFFWEDFPRVREIYYIVATPQDLPPRGTDTKVQSRWELECIEGLVFSWNVELGCFDCEENQYEYDPILQQGIEKFVEDCRINRASLHIRPAIVVRR